MNNSWKFGEDKLFIYPTDTVWGIGANVNNEELVSKINLVKGITNVKPQSILFSSEEQIKEYLDLPLKVFNFLELNRRFELTILVSKETLKKSIAPSVTLDSDWVGIRYITHCNFPFPITSTSLNLTNNPPITKLEDAKKFHNSFIKEGVLIENAKLQCSGNSSTIIKLNKDGLTFELIRDGNYKDEIQDAANKIFSA